MADTSPLVEHRRHFSQSGYRSLLEDFLDQGYQTRLFTSCDLDPAKAHLILRHDVDMSLDLSLVIAEIEAELGVSSVYYVLMTSPLYNPHSTRNREAIERLLTLDREVGLHFDMTVYQGEETASLDDLEEHVQDEADMLARLTGIPMTSMSFHRPAKIVQGYSGRIAGLIHSYEPRFFNDMAYVSDSQGSWRYGHPLDHDAVRAKTAIQLLTHPVWWAAKTPAPDTLSTLDRYVALSQQDFEQALGENCAPYRARLESLKTEKTS